MEAQNSTPTPGQSKHRERADTFLISSNFIIIIPSEARAGAINATAAPNCHLGVRSEASLCLSATLCRSFRRRRASGHPH
eukprot:6195543-Pleurochrysis_carterae.AAC.4